MTRQQRMDLAVAAVNVIAGTGVSAILQVATFPALGLAWAPIHLAQAMGLLTLAALARGASAWFIRRGRNGRGVMTVARRSNAPPGGNPWEIGTRDRRGSPAVTAAKMPTGYRRTRGGETARVCGASGAEGRLRNRTITRQSRRWFALPRQPMTGRGET
jgi:hypothetical protein